MLDNRNPSMGGSNLEKQALNRLEDIRSKYLEHCNHQNERNWVASTACMNRITLSRILFYNQIIQEITNIPGVIVELGVQWGALTSLLYNLISIYDPYNFRRKVVGFDTFNGFPQDSLSDTEANRGWKPNDLSTFDDIIKLITDTLESHQSFGSLTHMNRFELVQGDIVKTLPNWFDQNLHETVALAIFDMDIYKPTREALEHVLKKSQKGTILVFDEYCHPLFPEEGKAARELLNLYEVKMLKSPLLPYTSYAVL